MHPIVKILWFIFVLLLINFLSNHWLLALCIGLCLIAAKLHFESFLRVTKRMRWLFLSIFMIYAFGTPGEYIQQFPINFSPTHEGVQLGLLQIAKLLIALALLTMLFATSSKESLMFGLYSLLSPLKPLGFDAERFTARLILTLDYVDELVGNNNQKFHFHQLDDIYSQTDNLRTERVIMLESVPFGKLDKLMIILLLVTPFGFMPIW